MPWGSPSIDALQARASDFNPNQFGAGSTYAGGPRERLRQLEEGFRQNPGRAPNGTGSTGLGRTDSRGYTRMLEEQQEYLKLRQHVSQMPEETAPAAQSQTHVASKARSVGKIASGWRPPQPENIPEPEPAPTPAPPEAPPEAPELPELKPAPLPTAGGGGGGAADTKTPIVQTGSSMLNPSVGRRVPPVSMRVLVGRLY